MLEGLKVKLKKGLVVGQSYGEVELLGSMAKQKEMTIKKIKYIGLNKRVFVNENVYLWSVEMLDVVPDIIEDTIVSCNWTPHELMIIALVMTRYLEVTGGKSCAAMRKTIAKIGLKATSYLEKVIDK